ncbi:hypothetical protein [Kandleria sp.]|uniref:hypothetical protein n=1 Tax=Kandleria sp. TaxID=2774291 RepID=UPI001B573C67|nr:hypothetical protein [Kandleria sp.]MBP3276149.1 hypothetical protein [Kandleria sp.]
MIKKIIICFVCLFMMGVSITSVQAKRNHWKTEYIKFINKIENEKRKTHATEKIRYFLLDINRDSIPELFIENDVWLTDYRRSDIVLTSNNKKIDAWYYNLLISDLRYIPGKNKLYYHYEYKHISNDDIITIKKGKFKFTGGMYPYNELSTLKHYEWNNKKVSKKTYKKKLKAAFNMKKSRKIKGKFVSASKIKKHIKAY